jgi:Zn-dependent protease with chaperone function
MINPQVIDNLLPFEYEHPFDEKALDSLQKTTGLDMIIRLFNKHAVERIITIQKTGSGIHITGENYPKIYAILDKVCDIINLPKRPDLYMEWGYNINAFAIGVESPIIVLNSGAVDLLTDDELCCIIGHEVGHIKSQHMLYHQVGQVLPYLGSILGDVTLGIGKLISTPLQYALFHWMRMSEFTADRAGLLACQDIETATRVMMKLSGVPIRYFDDIKIESFMEQARRFEHLDYANLNKLVKFMSVIERSHPWTVIRAAEMLRWFEGGEYEQVLSRQTKERHHIRIVNGVRYCRKCGSYLQGAENFCNSCGVKLS